MVKPIRALTAARLQVLWNTVHRGRGALGFVAAVSLLLAGVACLIPPGGLFVVFGKVLGEDLPATDSPAMIWLAGLHALIVFGLGTMAGARSHASFDRELLRMLPMRRVQVLLSELPFNLLDTIPVLGLTFFAGLSIGLAQVLPGQRFGILVVFLQAVLSLVLVQQLVAVLRRLASRSKALLLALIGLPLLVLAVASQAGMEDAPLLLVGWLPTSAGYHALRAAALGEASAALGFHGLLALWNLALFALVAWLQFRELDQDPALRVDSGNRESLWSFRRPSAGVARLFVGQVLGNRFGKVLLILPLFGSAAFVLVAGILERSVEGRDGSGFLETALALLAKAEALPLFVVVPVASALFMGELWLNQFSWDGNGFKSLMLAPLRTTDLLTGKLIGLACLLVPQGLIACLPLLLRSIPSLSEVLAGALASTMVVVALGGFGHLLSAWYPRPHRGRGEGAASAPPMLSLLSTGAILLIAGLAAGVWFFLSGWGPWGPVAGYAGVAAGLLLAYRLLRPALAAEVDRRRELICETLT